MRENLLQTILLLKLSKIEKTFMFRQNRRQWRVKIATEALTKRAIVSYLSSLLPILTIFLMLMICKDTLI